MGRGAGTVRKLFSVTRQPWSLVSSKRSSTDNRVNCLLLSSHNFLCLPLCPSLLKIRLALVQHLVAPHAIQISNVKPPRRVLLFAHCSCSIQYFHKPYCFSRKRFSVAATEIDLVAYSLTFLSGDTLTTLRPNAFSMQFTLKGAAIPAMFGTPPAAPFSFAFFASDDAVLSGEDVRLTYTLTESTAGDLLKGIAANSTVTLRDVTSGL